MNNPVFTPFREHLPELLAHPECHNIILHLHSPYCWPLPCAIDEYVSGLDDEIRPLVEFVLACVSNPAFKACAREVEQTTLNTMSRNKGDDDSLDVFI